MKRLWIVWLLTCLLAVPAFAEDKGAKRELDFEGEVIEGMNRQPLDSMTQISEGQGDRSKGHLYRRRKKFHEENRELAREILETY